MLLSCHVLYLIGGIVTGLLHRLRLGESWIVLSAFGEVLVRCVFEASRVLGRLIRKRVSAAYSYPTVDV